MEERKNILLCFKEEADGKELIQLLSHLNVSVYCCNSNNPATIRGQIADRNPGLLIISYTMLANYNHTALKLAAADQPSLPILVLAHNEKPDAAEAITIMKSGAADICFDMNEAAITKIISSLLSGQEESSGKKERDTVYKSLFQKNHAVILVIDPSDGSIMDANDAACRFYGYKHSTLITMNIAEFNILSKDEILKEMQQAKTEQRKHFYFKHKIAGGETRDVEVYSGPIDIMGRTYLYSLIHDISDKKQTERMLIKSQQRYALAAKAGKTGVWEIYPLQKKIFSDSNLKMLFGYNDDDLSEDFNDWKKVFAEKDFKGIIDNINAIAEGIVNDYVMVTKVFDKKREFRWFRHNAKRIIEGENDEVRIIGSSTDITEQKIVEDKLEDYRLHLERMVEKRTSELAKINKQLTIEITERKSAENQLRQSELIFRTLAESTTAGILVTDKNLKPVFVNPITSDITGYRIDELMNMDLTLIIHPDIREQSLEINRKFMNGETINNPREITIVRKDGSTRWVSLSRGILKIGDNMNSIATFFDITDRKQLENELHSSKMEYERIVSSIPNTIYSIHTKNQKDEEYFYISPSIEQITGKPHSSFKSIKQLYELYHPDDLIIAMKYRELILNREIESFSYEHRYMLPDDSIKWIHNQGRVEYFGEKGLRIDGVLVDVTERRLSEEALKESEKKFRELAENINEIFWIEENGKLVYVSPAYERFWRQSVSRLYKNPSSFLDAVHPADRRKLLRAFSHRDYQDYRKLSEEFRVIWSENEMKWIWARSFLTKKSNGTIRSVGIAEDISLRKKAAEEIQAALEKSGELHELKSRLVSMVSHEFRTPLSIISSSVEILKDFGNNLSEMQLDDQFQNIDKAITTLTGLLDDIIMINRADLGKFELNLERFDIVNFINNIYLQTRTNSGTHTISSFSPNVDSAVILSDKKLLSHIFINLLTNAYKYTDKGKRVTCSLTVNSGNITLIVKDEGIGIPNTELSAIFEPFVRAENIGSRTGSGLGLAIVKRFTSLLNGIITVDSTLKKGSTFSVIIPLE